MCVCVCVCECVCVCVCVCIKVINILITTIFAVFIKLVKLICIRVTNCPYVLLFCLLSSVLLFEPKFIKYNLLLLKCFSLDKQQFKPFKTFSWLSLSNEPVWEQVSNTIEYLKGKNICIDKEKFVDMTKNGYNISRL